MAGRRCINMPSSCQSDVVDFHGVLNMFFHSRSVFGSENCCSATCKNKVAYRGYLLGTPPPILTVAFDSKHSGLVVEIDRIVLLPLLNDESTQCSSTARYRIKSILDFKSSPFKNSDNAISTAESIADRMKWTTMNNNSSISSREIKDTVPLCHLNAKLVVIELIDQVTDRRQRTHVADRAEIRHTALGFFCGVLRGSKFLTLGEILTSCLGFMGRTTRHLTENLKVQAGRRLQTNYESLNIGNMTLFLDGTPDQILNGLQQLLCAGNSEEDSRLGLIGSVTAAIMKPDDPALFHEGNCDIDLVISQNDPELIKHVAEYLFRAGYGMEVSEQVSPITQIKQAHLHNTYLPAVWGRIRHQFIFQIASACISLKLPPPCRLALWLLH